MKHYLRVADDLHAGRTPRQDADGVTVRFVCNYFLTDRQHRLTAGELSQRSFRDYRATCERLVAEFGPDRLVTDLCAADFLTLRTKLAAGWSPVTLANEVQRVRSILSFAWQVELLDKPVRFGPSFRKPSARILRQHRQAQGRRLFSPEDIRDLLDIASPELRAMVLLAVNCGFGNRDCAALPISRVDLQSPWLEYPRPKTSVERRLWLWSETRAALVEVLTTRKAPKDPAHEHLLFITKYGKPWYTNSGTDDPITKEFRKLLERLGIYRKGLSFYALRHTFETVAGETLDQVSVNSIMGHVDASMAATYREHISDERLQAVAEYVRTWLFGQEGGAA